VTPIAGGASTGAGPARRPSRLSQATVTNDAGRTIEGPVYRSTFLSAPEAVPVVPVVSTSSAVVVWLLALLPLAQLALIVVLAALHLPPGIGYVLLVAPSLGLPLSTALRRGRANDREKQPTARMIFSVVPPLYRLDPSVPLDAAGMAPVLTWLLLEGIAAAVLLFA
jgi:hypothetical protein